MALNATFLCKFVSLNTNNFNPQRTFKPYVQLPKPEQSGLKIKNKTYDQNNQNPNTSC